MSTTFRLVRGGADDLAFIMSTERLDGYDRLVGRWEEQRHRDAFVDGSHAYFIGYDGATPIGFVLLRFWDALERTTLVRRVAVVSPGQGQGRRLLAAVVARAFDETNVHRLVIGLFPDNLRARRMYEAIGFQAEGISRGSAYFDGDYRDELVMSLLRPEWRTDSI
ncbi:MAG TPA: GNAT family protein [Mesorhizobium sp.]|jgi:RimJ/RimL family protein N-acetyltransferase|uniref:GNAT family N-acetyltransferase n=1 Tax=Mesorhizobium sp. TaxID=1871066 RepID=UPI002DDDB068|nr:GNAT family protein [Mesorhizobium sp.]HEV2506564.1 GNAT family protein [Mesorhizobium sp.]